MVLLNYCLYNIVHSSLVLALQFSFLNSMVLYMNSLVFDSLLLCSLLETVVLVLIESDGCTLCQVEVLCLIFALLRNLQSLTALSACVGNHNQ